MAKSRQRRTVPTPVVKTRHWPDRNQLLTVSGVLLLLALTAMVLNYIHNDRNFPLQTVKVYGEFRHINAEEVYRELAAAGELPGFFNVNTEAMRRQIEAMPWVSEVSVRKVWPDALVIQVQEQQPLARWADGYLVNANGQLFKPDRVADFSSLPVFRGPEASEHLMYEKYKMVESRLSTLKQSVMALELDERRAWKLVLRNGLVLNIGRDFSELKISRYIDHFSELFADRELDMAEFDLRYTNGFSVKWKNNRDSVVRGPGNVKEG